MSYIKLGAIAFSLFAVTAFVWASEADELREKAKAMQREAAELAEKGHKKEAANLKDKAMAMLKEAEHLDHRGLDQRHPEIARLKALLEKLRQKEKELEQLKDEAGADEALALVRREAEEVEDKLRHMLHEPHDHEHGPHHEIAARMEHMWIAVDHLKQAGLHDIAKHVAERAEATERELHERHRHHEGDVMHEVMKQLDEIRHEIGRLRDEVNELKKR